MIVCAVAFGVALASVGSGAERGITLRKDWALSEHKALDPSAPAAEVADSVRNIASQNLSIGEDYISFGSEICDAVSFRSSEIFLEDYLQDRFGIGTKYLGLPTESARLIATTCDIAGFSEYVRLNDRRLMIFRDGLFLFFRPWVFY